VLEEMNVSKSISTQLCDGSTTDFMKSHVLSPDGTSALVISESNYVTNWLLPSNLIHKHLYYPTQSLHENRTNSGDIEREDEQLTFQSATDIGESIYDCVWYPHMSLSYPSSCCYLTTSRDHPIHLWSNNSTTNSNPTIQCSYLGYNHLDELDSAISLAFNLTGDKFYAGYNRMIRSFDLANPGKQSSSLPTSRTKRDSFGQKGLISSLSFNPMHSGLFAAGSYDSGSGVYLYQENMRAAVDHLTGGEEMGITCLKWSVCGNIVWVGGRKNSVISCYDIRFPKAELGRVTRELSSNQRMSFSLDPWGKYLATGTQDGRYSLHSSLHFTPHFLFSNLQTENL
jgi:telomerase Cajal body protein 1